MTAGGMTAEGEDWSDFSLMGLFRLEVETQTAELNRSLLAIEQSSDELDLHQHLESLMRAAHSIKGAARIVQLSPAVKIAHVLEDRFVAALEKQAPLSSQEIDALLAGVDLLSQLSLISEDELSTQLPAYEAKVKAVSNAILSLTVEPNAAPDCVPDDIADSPSLEKNGQVSVSHSNTAAIEVEPKQSKFTLSLIQSESISPEPVSPEYRNPEPISPEHRNPESKQPKSKQPESKQPESKQPNSKQPESKLESNTDTAERTIRMSAENLSRLMGIAGESLVEANWLEPFGQSLLQLKRQQQNVLTLLARSVDEEKMRGSSASAALQAMQSAHQLLNHQLDDLSLFSQRFSHLSDGLYREVVASHMCAFEEGTKGYQRLVRDLAQSVDKQVALEIKGLKTQVDRDILSKLDAPISHLLTNAVVHGIEPVAQRQAAGKPHKGTLRVEAVHRSGMLVVSIADDGAGVDVESLRHKVVEKGLTTAAVAQHMQTSELLEFLFLPGFSTAGSVDALAGRGYGLDLARNVAQSVGGSLQIFSKAGTGTTFQFQLPLTLSVMRSLLFEVGGETYAISLARIERVLALTPEQIHYSENRPYFVMASTSEDQKSESVCLVQAWQLLEAKQPVEEIEKTHAIVLGKAGNRYGVRVDRFIEEKELVVRPLDSRLGKVKNVSAAAITEQGKPILILDVADVLRSAERMTAESAGSANTSNGVVPFSSHLAFDGELKPNLPPLKKEPKRVLVVDDSMTVRAMEKKLLENRGYAVDIAVDGAEGWNRARMGEYDLVITDVDMPRMNGIELIKQMRDYRPTQQIPVIIVSYKDRKEDQMAGLDAGANYYLTKSSFHDDGLINAVVDLVGP